MIRVIVVGRMCQHQIGARSRNNFRKGSYQGRICLQGAIQKA